MKHIRFLLAATVIFAARLGLAATFTVTMNNDFFSPANLSVGVGDTVVWTNHSGLTHTSTSGTSCSANGLWNSGNVLGSGHSFSRTFAGAGSFPYFCSPHCSLGMTGSITVTNAADVPPSVTITNPPNNSIFTAPANVTIQASASDSDGTVTNVQFLVGATVLANVTTAPFSAVTNNMPAGSYTLSAIASDNGGARATNQINILVNAPNLPPSVSITNPIAGAKFRAPATVILQADASDTDGTVTNVQFFSGAASLGNVTAAPFNFTNNNLPAGNYTFTAKAFDNLGATTASSALSIFVETNAMLSGAAEAVNGQFQFTITGIAGQTYSIEASTNLTTWTPLITNVAPADTFNFTDSVSTNFIHRFYRARQDF